MTRPQRCHTLQEHPARFTRVPHCVFRRVIWDATLTGMPVASPAPAPAPSPSPAEVAAAEAVTLVAEAEELHAQYHGKIVEIARRLAIMRADDWTYRRIDLATGIAPSKAVRWVKTFADGDDRTGYVPVGRAVPEPES